jgi:hypothetical protein
MSMIRNLNNKEQSEILKQCVDNDLYFELSDYDLSILHIVDQLKVLKNCLVNPDSRSIAKLALKSLPSWYGLSKKEYRKLITKTHIFAYDILNK